MTDTSIPDPAYAAHPSHIQWGPVIAGAVTAAALAAVLHAFAAAIGLAVSSTAPTWRDASIGLWLLSGVYLILVALASYGIGGYVAGLLRSPGAVISVKRAGPMVASDDIEMRDGLSGLLVWAIATLLTALLLLWSASATTRLAASSAPAAGSSSVAGESVIAYDLDRLLRGDRRQQGDDYEHVRAESARILLTSSSHSGVAPDDRAYLVRLVAARTGLPAADTERRVDAALANAKNNIARARRSTVILAFMAGAAALLGAAAAWFAAVAGGEERDDRAPAHRWRALGTRRKFP